MNIGIVVVVVGVAWSALSLFVAMAVGSMAKERDTGARPGLDRTLAVGRLAPPTRDETFRAAI